MNHSRLFFYQSFENGKKTLQTNHPDDPTFTNSVGHHLSLSRVLRPPGGGSNISLGADEEKPPVRKNKMASSVFAEPEDPYANRRNNPPGTILLISKHVALMLKLITYLVGIQGFHCRFFSCCRAKLILCLPRLKTSDSWIHKNNIRCLQWCYLT